MATPFCRRMGDAVLKLASKKGVGGWYTPLMAAAERAILDRFPHVDLIVEVRDARMPSTSAFECLKKVCCFHKQVIVLNKVDLADHSQTEKWFEHFKNQDYITCGVNAHNRDSIKQLLSLIRSRLKELRAGQSNYTATVLLVGIPNVGKSAITNNIHQIGRIGAAEKGKLKNATVSPHPGETKDISSYKIASHPNLYILDSPGILPNIASIDVGAKMALTGAIKNPLIDEFELARYFLSILNMSEEYKQWLELKDTVQRKKRQYSSDHTQDFVVKEVRQTLFKTITSFEGYLEEENDMERIIDVQFKALHEALKFSAESNEDTCKAVAAKLLNLYRTGRLGRYTLDIVSG